MPLPPFSNIGYKYVGPGFQTLSVVKHLKAKKKVMIPQRVDETLSYSLQENLGLGCHGYHSNLY